MVLQPGDPVLGDGDGQPGPLSQRALRRDPLRRSQRHRRSEQDDRHLWTLTQAGLPRYRPGRNPVVGHPLGYVVSSLLGREQGSRYPKTWKFLQITFKVNNLILKTLKIKNFKILKILVIN